MTGVPRVFATSVSVSQQTDQRSAGLVYGEGSQACIVQWEFAANGGLGQAGAGAPAAADHAAASTQGWRLEAKHEHQQQQQQHKQQQPTSWSLGELLAVRGVRQLLELFEACVRGGGLFDHRQNHLQLECASPILPASKQWRRPAGGPCTATRLLGTAVASCNLHNIRCQGVGGQPRSNQSCRRGGHRGRQVLAKQLGLQNPAAKQRCNQRRLDRLLLLGQSRHVP